MKQLHRLIFKAFIPPIFLTFSLVVFVMVMQFLWLYVDDIIGKGISFLIILELLFYSACAVIPFSLPLSTLLSSIMTMGNFSEHNELLAMKASGISLQRILRPILFFCVGLVIFTFLFSNYVLPQVNLKFYTLLTDVRKARPEMQFREGIFEETAIDGVKIHIISINRETGMMYNVKVYNHSERKGNTSVIVSDSAKLKLSKNNKYLIFSLYSGSSYDDMEDRKPPRYPFQKKHFQQQDIAFEMPEEFTRSAEDMLQNSYKMLPMSGLTLFADSLQKEEKIKIEDVLRNYLYSSIFKRTFEFRDSIRYCHPIPYDSIYNLSLPPERHKISVMAQQYAQEGENRWKEQVEAIRYISRPINLYKIEWHRKWTYAVACLLFFFIGGPIGSMIRKGGIGLPLLIAMVIFIFYYVISISFEKLAKDGVWNVAVAMWFSTGVTLIFAGFTYYKAIKEISFSIPYKYKLLCKNKIIQFFNYLHIRIDVIDFYSTKPILLNQQEIVSQLQLVIELNEVWRYRKRKWNNNIAEFQNIGIANQYLESRKVFIQYYISQYQKLVSGLVKYYQDDDVLLSEIKRLPVVYHPALIFLVRKSTLHLKSILYIIRERNLKESHF